MQVKEKADVPFFRPQRQRSSMLEVDFWEEEEAAAVPFMRAFLRGGPWDVRPD